MSECLFNADRGGQECIHNNNGTCEGFCARKSLILTKDENIEDYDEMNKKVAKDLFDISVRLRELSYELEYGDK